MNTNKFNVLSDNDEIDNEIDNDMDNNAVNMLNNYEINNDIANNKNTISDTNTINKWKSIWRFDRIDSKNNLTNFNANSKRFFKKDDIKNHKKILCCNIVLYNHCDYDTKCMYAHSLNEQNINENRKQAYNILNSTQDLSHLDLRKNPALYASLSELTQCCNNCIKKKCTGGYNCKHGACLMLQYNIALPYLIYRTCYDTYATLQCNVNQHACTLRHAAPPM